MTREQWQELHPLRSLLESAFKDAQMPVKEWVNERPIFAEDYPESKIMAIVNVVAKTDALTQREKPKPKKRKPDAKAKK